MNTKIIPLKLGAACIIHCNPISDTRGSFAETFRQDEFQKLGLPEFVQENFSVSELGVLRGLHYQLNPKAQAKLVQCMYGAIYDVIVDITKSSSTYGQHKIIYMEPGTLLYVPTGFAHGFMSLRNNTVVSYKVSEYYSPEHDRGINHSDTDLAIKWPPHERKLSNKDNNAPLLKNAENNFE